MKKIKRYARYWIGRYWFVFGCCPNCNSSPPDENCWVCEGSYDYGPHLVESTRKIWRERWDRFRKEGYPIGGASGG